MLAYRSPEEPVLFARDGVAITPATLTAKGATIPISNLSGVRRHNVDAGFVWASNGTRTAAAVIGVIVTIAAALRPSASYPGVFCGVFVAWIFGIVASRTIRSRTQPQYGLVIFLFNGPPIALTSPDSTFIQQVADTLARLNPSLWAGANASASNPVGSAPPGGTGKLIPLAFLGSLMATCLHVRAPADEPTNTTKAPVTPTAAPQDSVPSVDVHALPSASATPKGAPKSKAVPVRRVQDAGAGSASPMKSNNPQPGF